MLNDFAEKKETFFGYKKQNFSKSKKSHFSKGVNPCLLTSTGKRNLSDYEKEFFKVQKFALPKGLAHTFGQKMSFSSLSRFGQNKTKKKP